MPCVYTVTHIAEKTNCRDYTYIKRICTSSELVLRVCMCMHIYTYLVLHNYSFLTCVMQYIMIRRARPQRQLSSYRHVEAPYHH